MEKGSLADAKLNGRILMLLYSRFSGRTCSYLHRAGKPGGKCGISWTASSVGRMGVLDIDSSMLFFTASSRDWRPAVLLAVLAVAGIGGMAVSLYLVWTGFCAGTILSVLSIRYGIRGLSFFRRNFPAGPASGAGLSVPFRWCQGFQDRVYNGRYGSWRRRKTGSASFRHFACNPGNAAGRLSGGELISIRLYCKSIFLFLKTGTISGTNINF